MWKKRQQRSVQNGNGHTKLNKSRNHIKENVEIVAENINEAHLYRCPLL